MRKLYGTAKTASVDYFIRTISTRDWILGHPELQILAEITGVQIQISLEAYNTTTGFKK